MSKKPSAAARTVDMFSGKSAVDVAEAAIAEAEDASRPDFEPMETRAQEYREKAFTVQEWTSKHFGNPSEGDANEYRVTRNGDWLYLEELAKQPGGKTYYAYKGYMFSKKSFLNAARAMAEAARQIVSEEKK